MVPRGPLNSSDLRFWERVSEQDLTVKAEAAP